MDARSRLDDLRGVLHLGTEGVRELADLVEAMHRTVERRPGLFGPPLAGPARGVTGLVYRSVRGVTALVGGGAGALLSGLSGLPALAASASPSPARDALLAALNGVVGDLLEATENPLALPMTLRTGAPAATGRAVVLVHGLCRNDAQWMRRGHDHGAALARDLGVTPVYVRYNSGLAVEENGRRLAERLEALASAWPVPLEDVAILAHSMGGLVARSACRHARDAGQAWPALLRSMLFLGTPHHGAPLERGGHALERVLGASPWTAPLARLGRVRSAGITDLRHGDARPLPEGIRCAAIAGSLPRLSGDGLVPVASALGRDPRGALAFREEDLFVARGTGHLDLLSSREVYERVRKFLERRRIF